MGGEGGSVATGPAISNLVPAPQQRAKRLYTSRRTRGKTRLTASMARGLHKDWLGLGTACFPSGVHTFLRSIWVCVPRAGAVNRESLTDKADVFSNAFCRKSCK